MKKIIKTARQLVAERASGVVSVGPDDAVIVVLQAMLDKDVSGVMVLDSGQLVGIVTERDYALKVELQGRTARDTRVHEIMATKLYCADADDSSERCMTIMHGKGVRHLPVLDQGRVIGMLSVRDVLEEVVAEEEHLIRDLEHERIEYGGDMGGSY
jgi:CBS domain-containing protein